MSSKTTVKNHPRNECFLRLPLCVSIATTLVAFIFAPSTQAATKNWNNGGTDWATAGNWLGGVPTNTDVASFDPQTGTGTTINNPNIAGLGNVASGLNLNNSFLGGNYNFTGTGTLTLGSGGVAVRGIGTHTIGGPILAGAAAGNLTLNVGTSAGLTLAGATTATTNSGAITVGGGTLTVNNLTSPTAKLTGNAVSVNGGGTLALVGNAAGTTLNLGNLATPDNGLGGNNVIRVTPSGALTGINFAATSTGSLRPGTRSTWDFQAASGNLGDATGARVTFTTAPFIGSANGLFANTAGGATVGFATVTDALGKNFATYNTVGSTALGVVSIANPGQTVATVTTVTTAAGLQGLSGTAKGQFDAPTGTTTVTGAIPAITLRISPASGATLAIGTNNIAAAGIMLDGANDFSITGTTGVTGSAGTHYFYVNNPSTTLSTSALITSGSSATVFAGPGFVSLTGTGLQNNGTSGNNYRISITGGVLRGSNTQLELTNSATRGVINFYGGVLEITGGTNGTGASADFRRSLGTSAGNANWGAGSPDTGSGGFSAFGAAASVNIGGLAVPASLTWNQTNFVGDGYALRFGSTKSNAVLNFLNPVALDSAIPGTYAAREINVTAGAGGDKTVLTGLITGSTTTDLIKTGTGRLEMTANNTYGGGTIISGGTLAAAATSPNQALGGTSRINVTNGTLLLGASNQINKTANLTLGTGGKLDLGGFSELDSGTLSGTTNGLGNLTLTDTSSLDFGTLGLNTSIIQFGGVGTQSGTLEVEDYDPGIDRLLFSGSSASFTSLYSQSEVSFNGNLGYETIQFTGFYEVLVPVPEPATIFGAVGLLGFVGFRERRRLSAVLSRLTPTTRA